MNRASRSFAPLLLGAALLVMGVSSSAAAQDPAAPGAQEEGGGGSPFHGYFATSAIAGFALFLVARTARR